MSGSIFELFTDERGNLSVRVSQEVQVLTHEEADRIAAEHKRLKDENEHLRDELAKLRVLARDMFSYAFNRGIELCNACSCADGDFADCSACDEYDGACGIARKRFEELYADRMRELGVVVDE